MKLPISPRLLACAGFVAPGERVADVGCDHGYLSIYLLINGISPSAIASDLRKKPLLNAVRNAEAYGVREKMQFFVSDGVKNIPHDFDCLVCAGMGGDTMVSILQAAPWLKSKQYRLILQCQSKTPMLRRFLSENGWEIPRESLLRDGKFIYTVMEVHWQPTADKLTPGQCYFPPALWNNPQKEVADYFAWVLEGVRVAATHRPTEELENTLLELQQMAKENGL